MPSSASTIINRPVRVTVVTERTSSIFYEADPRSLERKRYLRKNYLDPITGKEWQLIKDPAKGIIGVASSSEQEPLKKSNFP